MAISPGYLRLEFVEDLPCIQSHLRAQAQMRDLSVVQETRYAADLIPLSIIGKQRDSVHLLRIWCFRSLFVG
jgi:hypothetical protein